MSDTPKELMLGDCLDRLKELPDNSVDAVVTDPPYGISFMAKKWDYDVPSVDVWTEAMRVLKPGGHALIACGTRTQHRMVVNIEDAGFEIRDVVSWIYGSGFPKSLSISKSIDKQAGAEREVIGEKTRKGGDMRCGNLIKGEPRLDSVEQITAPATESAKQWDGWGTALKPSQEFFTLCRKPLGEKTVAANVLKWGTGGINVDGCRVEYQGDADKEHSFRGGSTKAKGIQDWAKPSMEPVRVQNTQGRFPANLIHDGSQEVLDLFPETKPSRANTVSDNRKTAFLTAGNSVSGGVSGERNPENSYTDQGSAARFFYCPKASKKDREEGNTHPTVKPTALMSYLCRLITPPGGVILDPYMGSGSTGKAARLEGFQFVGIEREPEFMAIAEARITNAI